MATAQEVMQKASAVADRLLADGIDVMSVYVDNSSGEWRAQINVHRAGGSWLDHAAGATPLNDGRFAVRRDVEIEGIRVSWLEQGAAA